MKINISLTWSETEGIKKYLNEVYEIERPTQKDVKEFIQTLTTSLIHSDNEIISNYIKQFEPNQEDIK